MSCLNCKGQIGNSINDGCGESENKEVIENKHDELRAKELLEMKLQAQRKEIIGEIEKTAENMSVVITLDYHYKEGKHKLRDFISKDDFIAHLKNKLK